jgi:hypothetical protein
MTQSLSSPRVTAALLEVPPNTWQRAVCPACHTPHASPMLEAPRAAVGWQCVRCGQRWNARRLKTVATYDAWAADHDRV